MSNYPKNRTYAIIPVDKAHIFIGNVLDIARKSNDKKFIVWDFPKESKTLNTLLADPDIKLLTHDEALALMATDAWQKKSEDLINSKNPQWNG